MRLCCETQRQTESALPSVRVHPWKNAGSHRAASFAAIFYRFEQAARLLALLTLACIPLGAQQTRAAATAARPAFVFGSVGYLHQWSQNDQHEFTPEGQEDLQKWSDMITMNVYPSAYDGDALAANAFAFEVLTESAGKWTVDLAARHTAASCLVRPSPRRRRGKQNLWLLCFD